MQTEFPAPHGPAPAATGAAKPPVRPKGDDDEPSEFERNFAEIRDKGFRAFVEELDEKKREELRKKILAAMGLSEEQLNEMPGEMRAQIEKRINEEIQRRLSAEKTLDGEGPLSRAETGTAPGLANGMANGPVPGVGIGTGPGLLQARQETERNASVLRSEGRNEG